MSYDCLPGKPDHVFALLDLANALEHPLFSILGIDSDALEELRQEKHISLR